MDDKHILESKTFWANAMVVVSAVIGWKFPTVGEFLKNNALELGGALGMLNIGLRSSTSKPITIELRKSL